MTQTTTKAFDCVALKSELQTGLIEEYRGRTDGDESLAQFLRAKARTSPWIVRQRERMGRTGRGQ